MEQEFILRLPETLRNVNPKDCKLVKTSQKEVNFMVGARTYPGIICKLPTIVESQKVVDNKLYKIADISALVVVYEDSNFNVDDEICKYESSGLTPPMYYARERRFAKTAVRTEDVERIERKVAELLKADSKALKVEVAMSEKDSTEADIDMLAAEIESELISFKSTAAEVPKAQARTEENALEVAGNGREAEGTGTSEHSKGVFEQQVKPSGIIRDKSMRSVEPANIDESPTKPEQHAKLNDSKSELLKSPEILELEQKIKEKQEQFDRAVNPILKKRFEQALETLNAEYQRKLEEQKK
ncbi:uncharacterized protein VICG_00637 [Vittaforma corneae ATCC 50505]|uniref:TAFII55 protein conserved region domain-containing protein n=1 Tax=Vittaforma corneae (strain ATCC 50505) TaxID=993615 RepID=L2GMW5_VITCO|nr:uncharacterized protein VICG_00637 [Vittaforma corneae ATCC 50505]ELA42238.1 hypothetical protein VICG_00637 [Vittaforma corneae ATCC 50505]